MTIRFLPKGGFNKNGAFRESNGNADYERQGFLTLEAICTSLKFARSWGLEENYGANVSELTEVSSEKIGGIAIIKRSLHGRYSLSLLGSNRAHSSLHVSIRKGEGKHISVVPLKAAGDLDVSWDESFSIDAILDAKAFDELRSELRDNPKFSVGITIRLDGMKGLYTTWSPSVSDGRVLKFLYQRDDVENIEELPEEFSAVSLGGERLPFTISVGDLNKGEDADVDPND